MDKNKDHELDKESRKRLDKLADKWAKEERPSFTDGLIASDLRLLLEHFEPLQDLIRAIAGVPTSDSPSALAQETVASRKQIPETASGQETVHEELAQTSDELAKALQTIRALEQDLAQCTSTSRCLFDDKQALEDARANLEKQLHQLQQQLNETQSELAKSARVPTELRLLRQDGELAQLLGLGNLPTDDTAALIKVVAVLSQRDNLQRLWSVLKDRCESISRMATNDEVSLLKAALSWHNHNWQSRPYQLINPTVGSNYDYERQLRSRDSSAGESVAELRLFGIADSSNKPLCKALVTTR